MEEFEQRLTDYSQLDANIVDNSFMYNSESNSVTNQVLTHNHEILFQQILNKLPKNNLKEMKNDNRKIERAQSFEGDSTHKQNYSFPSTRPSLKANLQNSSESLLFKTFKQQMIKYQKILSQKQIIIQQLWNRLEKVKQENLMLKNKVTNYRKDITNQLSESSKFKGYTKNKERMKSTMSNKNKDWASWTLNKRPPRPIR